MDAHRPLVKTASFAVVHFSVAFSVAYLLTGSAAISSLLALVEPLVNTFAYYLHERLWNGRHRTDHTRGAAGDRLAAA